MFKALSLKARWAVALILAGALMACVGWLILGPDAVGMLWRAKDHILDVCRTHPAVLFAALVILPGFGFPASALLVLAGAAWGSDWRSCALALVAMFLNMSWTYLLAAGPARSLIARVLGTRWDRWRTMGHGDRLRLAVLLRVTPGVPLFVQNYLLGLLAVPFLPYLLISVPINGIFVVGIVLTGGAIFEGRVGVAITGIAILVAAVLGVRLLRARFKSRIAPDDRRPAPQ
ncbi:MAG: hypothetical protein NTW21_14955 [Verrucomicrobia bacterium]|nr:hypothetical protein [Verrucomicrobiota bacterium]